MAHKNEEHTSFAVLDFDQKMKKNFSCNFRHQEPGSALTNAPDP